VQQPASPRAIGEEVTLFDSQGAATAYVAIEDDLTIYLWDGTPVAYLAPNTQVNLHVYSFDGTHLGWLEDGIIWNHNGDAQGALRQAFSSAVQLEPLKASSNSSRYEHSAN